jgi:hypothetical protein
MGLAISGNGTHSLQLITKISDDVKRICANKPGPHKLDRYTSVDC